MLETAPTLGLAGSADRAASRASSEREREGSSSCTPQPTIKCENDEGEVNYTVGDGSVDFSTDADFLTTSKQSRQNPTSHRIIEKRRRDRMNNCLADLSRLIPPDYLKKGRGRIEKTEIIEMATRYIKTLQDKNTETQEMKLKNHFRLGYKECLSEVMKFLTESQVHYPTDSLCVQLVNHLEHRSDKLSGDYSMKLHPNPGSNSSSCGSSGNYAPHTTSNAQQSIYHDSDTKDRQHSHYNIFTGHSEAPYSSMTDIERSQQDENSEGNTMEPLQKKLLQQTVSLMSNNFTMNKEEGGETTRSKYMRNILSLENGNGYRLPQDMILNANYPVMSPEYRQPYSIQQMHEPSLRSVRKVDSSQPSDSGLSIHEAADGDNIHLYKFKNTIKQRFSQSQSTDYSSSSPSDGVMNMGSLSPDNPSPVRREQFLNNAKFMHKRRKVSDHHNRHTKAHYYQTSSTGTNSSMPTKMKNSLYRCNNTTQQIEVKEDTKPENKQGLVPVEKKYAQKVEDHKFCENFSNDAFPSTGVPVFALHAKGSFYVPLNIDYECLIPFLGPYNLLEAAGLHPNISLHPVTISVNFQPT